MNYKIRDKESSYRYERKFLINDLTVDEITSLVNINSSMFNFSFNKRIINNIYFDNFNFNNYHENVEGSTDRIKIRIRWYGDLFSHIKKPKLEIKIKKGFLGTKKTTKLKSFNLNGDLSNIFKPLKDNFIYSRYNLNTVSPVLLNSYTRCYYISNNKSYRITIDNKQSYYKIFKNNNSFLHKVYDDNSTILEIKYNDLYDDNVNAITNSFPFRMTKNSKYVNGIEAIYSL
tara:strand:+ start:434 stop:1123 length:690 start_codon:yes stop_codon:yes gene_type:complete